MTVGKGDGIRVVQVSGVFLGAPMISEAQLQGLCAAHPGEPFIFHFLEVICLLLG